MMNAGARFIAPARIIKPASWARSIAPLLVRRTQYKRLMFKVDLAGGSPALLCSGSALAPLILVNGPIVFLEGG
jgi:hypothetical protein